MLACLVLPGKPVNSARSPLESTKVEVFDGDSNFNHVVVGPTDRHAFVTSQRRASPAPHVTIRSLLHSLDLL